MNSEHAPEVENCRRNGKSTTSVKTACDVFDNSSRRVVCSLKVSVIEALAANIALEDEQSKTLKESRDEIVAG